MVDAVERKQRRIEEEIERLWAALVLGLGCVLALVSLFVPMFSYGSGDDLDRGEGQATLLGLVGDPGRSDVSGVLAIAALVAWLGIATCVALTPVLISSRRSRDGWFMVIAAVAVLVAVVLLLSLTVGEADGTAYDISPAGGLALAGIVPIWFLIGRSRAVRD